MHSYSHSYEGYGGRLMRTGRDSGEVPGSRNDYRMRKCSLHDAVTGIIYFFFVHFSSFRACLWTGNTEYILRNFVSECDINPICLGCFSDFHEMLITAIKHTHKEQFLHRTILTYKIFI